jgi:hypothetical protein
VDTFLGTLSGQILALRDLPITNKVLQVAAVIVLCVVIVQAIRGLWPSEFQAPPKPKEWLDYAAKLEEYYAGNDSASDLVLQDFEVAVNARTLDRIAINADVTLKKSNLNAWAFRGTAVAVGLELVTLLWLALWHL